jgi:mRNA interferase RelE/StbE
MTYAVVVPKSVQKQIDKLTVEVRARVIVKIQSLAVTPRPDGVSKLKGYTNQYRIRVRSYRVRYEVNDDELIVKLLQCKHRREIYKDKK